MLKLCSIKLYAIPFSGLLVHFVTWRKRNEINPVPDQAKAFSPFSCEQIDSTWHLLPCLTHKSRPLQPRDLISLSLILLPCIHAYTEFCCLLCTFPISPPTPPNSAWPGRILLSWQSERHSFQPGQIQFQFNEIVQIRITGKFETPSSS